ncbi:putative small auxin-up RNA [Helianthus debilis subsp. tardiflorus]
MPLHITYFSLHNKMLGKKIGSFKNLAKKAKIRRDIKRSQSERLLRGNEEETSLSPFCSSPCSKTPTGFFTVYVGEERRRFVVPTGYLSHPLFKMLLEKSSEEFGFGQKNGLVVPCSVDAFQEVVSAVESCNGKCDLSHLVEEFL